jgi:hypothetical protein
MEKLVMSKKGTNNLSSQKDTKGKIAGNVPTIEQLKASGLKLQKHIAINGVKGPMVDAKSKLDRMNGGKNVDATSKGDKGRKGVKDKGSDAMSKKDNAKSVTGSKGKIVKATSKGDNGAKSGNTDTKSKGDRK